MFQSQPDRTTRNYRLIRERLGTTIFGSDHKLEPYYAAALASYRLEFLFRNRALDAKYKAARYHLLLALRIMLAPNDPPRSNARQNDTYCKPIIDTLLDNTTAQQCFADAARIIEEVSGGNLNRDNVRTQPFTESLINRLKP